MGVLICPKADNTISSLSYWPTLSRDFWYWLKIKNIKFLSASFLRGIEYFGRVSSLYLSQILLALPFIKTAISCCIISKRFSLGVWLKKEENSGEHIILKAVHCDFNTLSKASSIYKICIAFESLASLSRYSFSVMLFVPKWSALHSCKVVTKIDI